MKKTFYIIVVVLTAIFSAQAQQLEGIISYERTTYWTKIIARLPYLSQEEKDRAKMTWGNEDGNKEKMKLVFTPNESVYTYQNEQAESDDGQYAWRQEDFLVERNFAKETILEWHEMLGRTYVMEDSLRIPSWKVLNQLKDIAGHVCMKAEMHDPIKNQKVIAWFADDLPVSAGPERSFGLPGMIMELDINDGDVVITATKVEMKKIDKELKLPKMKGKKIKQADYNRLISEHIKDSIKSHRNPYWSLRY